MKDLLLILMLRGFERKKYEQSLPPSIGRFEEYHRLHQENKSTWQFSRGGNSSLSMLSIRETIFYAAFLYTFLGKRRGEGVGERKDARKERNLSKKIVSTQQIWIEEIQAKPGVLHGCPR